MTMTPREVMTPEDILLNWVQGSNERVARINAQKAISDLDAAGFVILSRSEVDEVMQEVLELFALETTAMEVKQDDKPVASRRWDTTYPGGQWLYFTGSNQDGEKLYTRPSLSDARLMEALGRYEAAANHVGGCRDGNCVVVHSIGQHTNGGCRCYTDKMKAQRMMRAGQALYNTIKEIIDVGKNLDKSE